jgi:two-component system, chemotaxis family, CheB/CheR fusion protein
LSGRQKTSKDTSGWSKGNVEIEPKSIRGEGRTLLVNARRLQSPDQEQLILMAFEDITERKKAAEARYRRLFESARDGIVIVDAHTGEILDLNPYAENPFGYRKDDLIGTTLWEFDSMRSLPNAREVLEQTRERVYCDSTSFPYARNTITISS